MRGAGRVGSAARRTNDGAARQGSDLLMGASTAGRGNAPQHLNRGRRTACRTTARHHGATGSRDRSERCISAVDGVSDHAAPVVASCPPRLQLAKVTPAFVGDPTTDRRHRLVIPDRPPHARRRRAPPATSTTGRRSATTAPRRAVPGRHRRAASPRHAARTCSCGVRLWCGRPRRVGSGLADALELDRRSTSRAGHTDGVGGEVEEHLARERVVGVGAAAPVGRRPRSGRRPLGETAERDLDRALDGLRRSDGAAPPCPHATHCRHRCSRSASSSTRA